MKKFFEIIAMLLILWGLFVLGYFCGFADTLGLHKYIETPNFHQTEIYKEGNIIIRRYKNHEEFNRNTIDNYDDRREWM